MGVPFLHEQLCPAAHFERCAGNGMQIVLYVPPSSVPWIPFDIAAPPMPCYPDFAKVQPVEVSVSRGEMMYLPAMWYHRVGQRGITVAVNYWHDMQFGHAYVQHQFLRDVVGLEDSEEDFMDYGSDSNGY